MFNQLKFLLLLLYFYLEKAWVHVMGLYPSDLRARAYGQSSLHLTLRRMSGGNTGYYLLLLSDLDIIKGPTMVSKVISDKLPRYPDIEKLVMSSWENRNLLTRTATYFQYRNVRKDGGAVIYSNSPYLLAYMSANLQTLFGLERKKLSFRYNRLAP